MATKTPLTPDQMRTAAAEWYERQLELLQRCHGARWPDHEHWVKEYLSEQLRARLIEHGWRVRR